MLVRRGGRGAVREEGSFVGCFFLARSHAADVLVKAFCAVPVYAFTQGPCAAERGCHALPNVVGSI